MKKILIFVICITIAVSIAHVVVSNSLTTSGVALSHLEEEKSTLQDANELLLERILIASSYTKIASQAGEQGFTKARAEVVLQSPQLAAAP